MRKQFNLCPCARLPALIIDKGGQPGAVTRPLSLCGTAPFAVKLAKIVPDSPESAMCAQVPFSPPSYATAPELFLPPTSRICCEFVTYRQHGLVSTAALTFSHANSERFSAERRKACLPTHTETNQYMANTDLCG